MANILILGLTILTFLIPVTFFIKDCKKVIFALILLSIFFEKNLLNIKKLILLAENLK